MKTTPFWSIIIIHIITGLIILGMGAYAFIIVWGWWTFLGTIILGALLQALQYYGWWREDTTNTEDSLTRAVQRARED